MCHNSKICTNDRILYYTILYDTIRHDGIRKAMIGSEGYEESILLSNLFNDIYVKSLFLFLLGF